MNGIIPNRARKSRRIAAALAVALLAGLALPGARAGDEKAIDTHGKIVVYAQFIADDRRGGQEWGLHVVDPLTNTWTRIAEYPIKNGPIPMANIRVSPDATRLAFNEYRDHRTFISESSVWLRDLRPDVEPRKISDIGGRPIWSPDGKHLLVVEVTGGGPDKPPEPSRFATWKIDDDGSHAIRLPVPETDMISDWSADGRWLVAYSPTPGKEAEHAYENVIMHTDGTSRRRLPGPGAGFSPRFSPDGKRIAYVTRSKDERSMKGKSIWVVGVDGKDRHAIYKEPDSAYLEDAVTWSPDGKQLAAILQTWTRVEPKVVTPRDPRLCIINLEDRRMRIVPHRRAALLGRPDWR
jgi:Tol biopolymer transport system component